MKFGTYNTPALLSALANVCAFRRIRGGSIDNEGVRKHVKTEWSALFPSLFWYKIDNMAFTCSICSNLGWNQLMRNVSFEHKKKSLWLGTQIFIFLGYLGIFQPHFISGSQTRFIKTELHFFRVKNKEFVVCSNVISDFTALRCASDSSHVEIIPLERQHLKPEHIKWNHARRLPRTVNASQNKSISVSNENAGTQFCYGYYQLHVLGG